MEGQYISSVTYPDTTQSKITTDTDLSYRYASYISSSDIRSYLSVLASDSLEGRETGTKGIDMAAEFISNFTKELNLNPIDSENDYFQPIIYSSTKWNETEMRINGNIFELYDDYVVLADQFEGRSTIKTNEILFLGYGIDDPRYNSYKDVDVTDKIIMIFNGEPINPKNGKSYITKSHVLSEWSTDITKKLKVAKEKGAKLVLIIDDDFRKTARSNRRNLFYPTMTPIKGGKQPLQTANYAYISNDMANEIIGDYQDHIENIKTTLDKGKTANLPLQVDFIAVWLKKTNDLRGNNIIATIDGRSKKDEYIIISAHYDHLGKRGNQIYNGADDNGSGSSLLMSLAKAFKKAELDGHGPERSVVFMWMTGEEKGLLGSRYYVEYPIFPLEQTVVDLNIDMVGRVDEKYTGNPNYIYVIGSDRLSSDLHKINEEANQKYTQLILDYTYNSEEDPNQFYYRSDHYNFAKNGIPAAFYFSGIHEDYHKPGDTVDKIDFDKITQIGKLIFHTAWEIANRPNKIEVDGKVETGGRW